MGVWSSASLERLQPPERGRSVPRDIDGERGATAGLAVDLDEAARLLDDAVDARESQPGALAHALGGEIRLEDLVQRHGDALTGVGDGQHREGGRGRERFVDVAWYDGQHASARHRVARVQRQVARRPLRVDAGRRAPARATAKPTSPSASRPSPSICRRMAAFAVTRTVRSTTSGQSICFWPNARNWRVSTAARCPAPEISSNQDARLGIQAAWRARPR